MGRDVAGHQCLVLARTGVETKLDVHNDRETGTWLDSLQPRTPELKKLIGKYTDQWVDLFGRVLCDGNVDPIDATMDDIQRRRQLHPRRGAAGEGVGETFVRNDYTITTVGREYDMKEVTLSN